MPRVLLALLFLRLASAQTGILRGRVTDESGAVVPGAAVAVRGPVTRSAKADGAGTYTVANLPPGDYTVEANAPALTQPQVRIAIHAGAQSFDLVLHVAALNEKVSVQENGAPAVGLDPSSNASAVVIRGADLDALSDDPDDLAADLAALAGPAAGPAGGAIFIDGFSGGELPPKQ